MHYDHSHKNQEKFVKEKRKGKRFIFMTILSFKQVESNYSKKEPCEQGGLLSFLTVWILDTINMLFFFNSNSEWLYMLHSEEEKKSLKWTTFDAFLRRVNFILIFFQEELAPLLSAGKPFSSDLEG